MVGGPSCFQSHINQAWLNEGLLPLAPGSGSNQVILRNKTSFFEKIGLSPNNQRLVLAWSKSVRRSIAKQPLFFFVQVIAWIMNSEDWSNGGLVTMQSTSRCVFKKSSFVDRSQRGSTSDANTRNVWVLRTRTILPDAQAGSQKTPPLGK